MTAAPVELYDRRHAAGWMDAWPRWKRERVTGCIRAAGLSPGAKVLEFGCGVGVFAQTVQEAFPGVEVHGCDISRVAVERARQRCRGVTLHLLGPSGCEPRLGTFDLIYSHHVLEYVPDVSASIGFLAGMLRPAGRMLHIVPCAASGSLERRLSAMTGNGAGPRGLLCSDDPSHARRLSPDELIEICGRHGLRLRQALFVNQFWGALEYLTGEHYTRLLEWFRPSRGLSIYQRLRLRATVAILATLAALRTMPPYLLRTWNRPRTTHSRIASWAVLPLALLAWPASRALDRLLTWAASREWRRRRTDPNGSEMYLFFERISA